MTGTGMDPEQISQNLSDAGCSEEMIRGIIKAAASGNYRKMNAMVDEHRKQLLEQYRNSKRCIDCLDYFTYQFDKSMGESK